MSGSALEARERGAAIGTVGERSGRIGDNWRRVGSALGAIGGERIGGK